MSSDSHSNGDSSSFSDHDDGNGLHEHDHEHEHGDSSASDHGGGGGGGVKFDAVAAPKGKRTVRADPDPGDDSPPFKKKALSAVPGGAPGGGGSNGGSGGVVKADLEDLVVAKGVSLFHQRQGNGSGGAGVVVGSGGGVSSAKPAKKSEKAAPGEYRKPPGWAPDDEMTLAKVLIGCSSGGQVQMGPFYERAHEALPETSNSQVYDKMRRMRTRFWQIRNGMSDSGISEERFQFRSHHEAHLYKIWKQIWGDEHERHPHAHVHAHAHAHGNHGSHHAHAHGHGLGLGLSNGNRSDDEPPPRLKLIQYGDLGPTPLSDDEEHGHHHVLQHCSSHHPYGGSSTSNKSVMSQVKSAVQSALEEGLSKVEATVLRVQAQSFDMDTVISKLTAKLNELVNPTRLPNPANSILSGSDARTLRHKWRRVRTEELRLFSAQLDLLQDECRMWLKRLDTSHDRQMQ